MSVDDRLRRIGSNIISRRSSGVNMSVCVATRAKERRDQEIKEQRSRGQNCEDSNLRETDSLPWNQRGGKGGK